jgi:1-deoxyxylulose-5-phosphate synthase
MRRGSPLPMRPYGNTGLTVSRIGLGCVTFGREIGEDAAFEIMDCAVEFGINLFDTAEAYGGGASERIVGRWLRARGCAGSVIVQTKVSPPLTPARVREAFGRSRERLAVERIGAYLLHTYDAVTPLDETLAALAEVRAHVTAIGASNFTVAQMAAAEAISDSHPYPRIEVLQPPYSLIARGIEHELLDSCRARGIGVGSYSPLAAGFLTGKYKPGGAVPKGTRFDVIPGHRDIYFTPRSFAVVERLRELSARTGVPMAHLSMAWAFREPRIHTVLVGARTPRHVIGAADALLAPLAGEWLEEMNSWSAGSKIEA